VTAQGLQKQDEAGVALAFAKLGSTSQDSFHLQVLAPGRVIRVSVAVEGFESIYWCVHNFGLSALQMQAIGAVLENNISRAAAAPSLASAFVLGDFNFLCEGEYQRSLDLPNDSTSGSHSLPAPWAWQARWQHLLSGLTELAQPLDTHFSPANSLCSRIDRIYTTIPPWLLTQLNVHATLHLDPKAVYDAELSDHTVLKVNFASRKPLPADQRPISRHVVSDPLYATFLQQLVDASSLDALAVPLRLSHFKILMREAARLVRDGRAIRF
jgi:hypothetical protein